MIIEYGANSDTGKERSKNEDSFGVLTSGNLYVVCDGMGGHSAGDFASKTAIFTIIDIMKKPFDKLKETSVQESGVSETLQHFATAIKIGNRRLFNLAVKYPKLRGMGTTVTACLIKDGMIHICHVGDSRIYRFRGKKLMQQSLDHSWVNELLQDGEIT